MLVEQTSPSNLSTHPTSGSHRWQHRSNTSIQDLWINSFRLEAVLLRNFSTCCKSSSFLKLIYPRLFMMGSRAPIRSWKIIAPIRSPGYFSIYFTFIFVNRTRILFPSLQSLQQNPHSQKQITTTLALFFAKSMQCSNMAKSTGKPPGLCLTTAVRRVRARAGEFWHPRKQNIPRKKGGAIYFFRVETHFSIKHKYVEHRLHVWPIYSK